MKKFLAFILCGILVITGSAMHTQACTLIYVGEDVSEDGSSYIARSEDLNQNHNKIFHVIEAADHKEQESYLDMDGYTFEYPSHTFRYTEIIDDPDYYGGEHDYPEVGFNERNVYVSATVSTGYNKLVKNLDQLVNGGITEISMAAVMLQEAVSARHAMEILAREIDKKGAGECNIIVASDPNETWLMEIVSGHQYAAVKLHKDEAAVIPNNMVLDNVGRYDDYIISEKLLKIAQDAGTAVFREGADQTVENLLVAESYSKTFNSDGNKYRFWGGLNKLNKILAEAFDVESEVTQLPNHQAFVKPDHKLTLQDVMDIEAYRYEDSKYATDLTGYRAIGAETQIEIHIAQFRPNMEAELSGIQWQAFANGEFTVYIPYFTNLITETHESYQVEGTAFDENGFYWNFEKVMQLCAQNRDLYGKAVRTFWGEYQNKLFTRQTEIDQIMISTPEKLRSEVATKLGMQMAEDVFQTEKAIREQLEAHIVAHPDEVFVLNNIDANLPVIDLEVADYTAVNVAVKEAVKLNKDLYKDFSLVEEALNAVVFDLYYTQQDDVDAMAKAITDAISALEYKDADYSRVDAAIAEAGKLNPKDYKDFSLVEEALNAVVRGKNITEQEEVDAMAQAIMDAVNALEKKTVVSKPETPKTGDTMHVVIYIIIALIALGGGILFKVR